MQSRVCADPVLPPLGLLRLGERERGRECAASQKPTSPRHETSDGWAASPAHARRRLMLVVYLERQRTGRRDDDEAHSETCQETHSAQQRQGHECRTRNVMSRSRAQRRSAVACREDGATWRRRGHVLAPRAPSRRRDGRALATGYATLENIVSPASFSAVRDRTRVTREPQSCKGGGIEVSTARPRPRCG